MAILRQDAEWAEMCSSSSSNKSWIIVCCEFVS
jgi:hypothetical protein